ncbi:syntaxin binding protein 1 [Coemansia sp. RSA 2322]|nr:syntaxin binding protein 1 [Coemansia sp. RSA 2322]
MESVARPCSLVELLRRSIISAIGQTAGATGPSQWRVVVVDRPSLKIISTVLKMHAILEQNVLAVQLITKNRQPYPDADAVYVLIPCAESIAQVIDDFTSVADDAQRLKYSRAHLFFTGALSDSLFSRLSTSPAAPYIKGIAELFVEYNPIESRVFLTTPSSKPFYSLYSPKAADMLDRDLDASSDRLLSAIASLGIHPYVRYYRPPEPARIPTDGGDSSDLSRPYLTRSSHQVAEAMANRLQDKLNDYYAHERRKAENCRQRSTTDLQPSTVIVLDRSVDMYAPLVHEFTYQAMAHDLIGFENGDKYVYTSECANGETQQVEAELAESTDPLWEQMRHMHISSVSQTLIDRLDRLVSENVGIKAISSL